MKFRTRHTEDLQSYVELMIAHQDRLRAFVYSLIPGSPDVDDVLQNTNAVLWQKRASFEEGTNFTAWAFKIARYQAKHQLARHRRDSRVVFSDEVFNLIADAAPVDEPHDRQLSALERCMAKLTSHQRELIQARYTLGQSLEQLAADSGRSAGGLRIALHRVREILRQCVKTTLTERSA